MSLNKQKNKQKHIKAWSQGFFKASALLKTTQQHNEVKLHKDYK